MALFPIRAAEFIVGVEDMDMVSKLLLVMDISSLCPSFMCISKGVQQSEENTTEGTDVNLPHPHLFWSCLLLKNFDSFDSRSKIVAVRTGRD